MARMKRAHVCWTVAVLAVIAGCGIVTAQNGQENDPPAAKLEAPGGSAASERETAVSSGNVYTMTNATDGNEVVVYERNALGEISERGRFPTGGNGASDLLADIFGDAGKHARALR